MGTTAADDLVECGRGGIGVDAVLDDIGQGLWGELEIMRISPLGHWFGIKYRIVSAHAI